MARSRTENSIKNSSVALITQGINVVLNFITRTVFIKFLGASYLGINGLFTNILSVLSFAELGFGTAIVFMLYEPLAKNDQRGISAIMNFYKKVYNIIGFVILGLGIAMIPLLPFFINDAKELPANLPPLWVIYLLYVISTSSSYFFNYKRSIIIASQNGYLDSFNTLIFNILRNILQCIMLMIWHSFLVYLIIQISCTILSNIFMARKADKLFPFMKENRDAKIGRDSLKTILKNVTAMSMHKISSVIVSSTDNILIAKFVGLTAAGYYSNYTMITLTLKTVYTQAMSPVTASVGNLIASESKEKLRQFTVRMFFLNACIAIFFSSCLASLVNPFISLFWGAEYVFDYFTVLLIVLSFYLNCMRQTMIIMIDAGGLFWKNKWKGLVEATVNLVVSIVLAGPLQMGINGIVIGTIISCISTNLWWDPYVVYKYSLEEKISKYFKSYFIYSLVFVFCVASSLLIEFLIPLNFITFFVYCLISVAIPIVVIVGVFHKTDSFQYFKRIAANKISKVKNKKGEKR